MSEREKVKSWLTLKMRTIRSMIDFAMSIEEAEEELFDHYANEVI